jgi:predicted amidohydrolase
MSSLRVAIAQISPALGDIDRNLETHLSYIQEAAGDQVQLLLFPELSLTGYNLGPRNIEVALWRNSPPILRLAQTAGEMYVVMGFVEEGSAAQFYNSCAVVHQGEVVYIHRKLNLATYGQLEEGKYYGTGRYVETFLISPPWRGSVLICADLWNPALAYLAALHGSTLLLAPTSSSVDSVSSEFSNLRGWDLATRYYAMIYGMPILMANRVGSEGRMKFWGGSQVIDPFGNPLVSADNESEQLIVAELDYELVRKARHQLPTVRDSNLALVRREITRTEEHSGIPPTRKTS